MGLDRLRTSWRVPLAVAIVAFGAFGFVACGGDDDEEAQSLSFTLNRDGVFQAPSSAETGLTELTLRNDSNRPADVQLIHTTGDHSAQEVIDGFAGTGQGKPLPDWFFAGGGTPTIRPGATATVSQVLEPGTYFAFNTNQGGLPKADELPAIEVTGEASEDELPEADAEVETIDYGFKATGLTAGSNQITFVNTGAQPHHVLASPIEGNATIEEVEKTFRSPQGRAPIDEQATQSTAVIDAGDSQVVTLDLEPGRYALYCFISDRQGGPPHALKGMVDEVEVE
jgi:plastocyanin